MTKRNQCGEAPRRCSECGGTNVEMLFAIWVDANTFEDCGEVGQIKTGPGHLWCRDCEAHPSHIDGAEPARS